MKTETNSDGSTQSVRDYIFKKWTLEYLAKARMAIISTQTVNSDLPEGHPTLNKLANIYREITQLEIEIRG